MLICSTCGDVLVGRGHTCDPAKLERKNRLQDAENN